MAHTARAYPGFCSINWLGIFMSPSRMDADPWQGYPQHYFAGMHSYTWVKRDTVRVKCLAACPRTQRSASATITTIVICDYFNVFRELGKNRSFMVALKFVSLR